MIVPMISLADYLAAQHDSADAVPIYFSALKHLQANPVSILDSEEKQNYVTKALTKHYIEKPRQYDTPHQFRIEFEAVMPLVQRGFYQFEVMLGVDSPTFVQLHHRLAYTYMECDMEKEGKEHLTLLLQSSEKAVGPAHEQTRGLLQSLIYFHWDRDHFAECDALIRRCLQNGGSIGRNAYSSLKTNSGRVPNLETLGVPKAHGWAWDDRRLWLNPPETVDLVPIHPSDTMSLFSNGKSDDSKCDTNTIRYTLKEMNDKILELTVPYVPYESFQQCLENEGSGTYQNFMDRISSCYPHRGQYWPQQLSFHKHPPLKKLQGRQKHRVYFTEDRTQEPGQALALLSEDSPKFIGGALSEIRVKSLRVQDFMSVLRMTLPSPLSA